MRTLLLALTGPLILSVSAQNAIYRSYEECAARTGEQVEGPMEVLPRMGRFVLTFEKDGKEASVPCRKLWGFRCNNILFRIEPEGHLPVRLMAQGAVFYWENGFAHLRMLRDSMQAAGFEYGRASYLSRDLQGEIVPASFAADDTRSASGKFRAANPQYTSLLDCIGAGGNMDLTRQCVVEYEVAVEEKRAAAP
jgi:hypothetical protein